MAQFFAEKIFEQYELKIPASTNEEDKQFHPKYAKKYNPECLHPQANIRIGLKTPERLSPIAIGAEDLQKITVKELDNTTEKISKIADGFYSFENKENPIRFRKKLKVTTDEKQFKQKIESILSAFEKFEQILYTSEIRQDLSRLKVSEQKPEDTLNFLKELEEFKILEDKLTFFLHPRWWELRSKYKEFWYKNELATTIARWEKINPIILEMGKSLTIIKELFNPELLEIIKKNITDQKSNLEEVNYPAAETAGHPRTTTTLL